MFLINKHNLAIADFASKEESRYTLKAIHVSEERTAATDGHALCVVSTPKNTKPENFPAVQGFTPNGSHSFLLGVDLAKKIEKSIPKDRFIPAINHAAATADEDGNASIAVNDLRSSGAQVFRQSKMAGSFPVSTDQVLKMEKPTIRIRLDARLLAKVAKAAAAFADDANHTVLLSFTTADRAMLFEANNSETGQTMQGAVMPCRQ